MIGLKKEKLWNELLDYYILKITVDSGDEDIDAEIIDELMNILNRKYLLKK